MSTEMDVVVAALIGFVIGAVLMAIIGRSGSKKNEETAKLQAEYDSYREKVNAHFAKTADAVDGLTKSYQQVFDHLSDGAQNLMDQKALQAQLEKRQGKAVTLAYLVDQKEGSPVASKKVPASSVVHEEKPTVAPMVKKEAPVPAEEKAEVIAQASKVKTPEHGAPSTTTAGTTAGAAQVKAAPMNQADAAEVKPPMTASPASNKPAAQVAAKPSPDKEVERKTQVQQAAEKAGLKPKPAETIVDNKRHESAIDAVKKHIKDDQSGTKS